MYTTTDYWKMLADHPRRDAYAEAIIRSVQPGAVVVNIGAGTGMFALLACQAGARRVYAIEPADIIGVARDLAAANGFGNRIVFIQDLSTNAAIPERADVIVSDLRGVLPLFGQHLPSIVDARHRFLDPHGVLIPERDEIWSALVSAPELYAYLVAPWGSNPQGFDWEPARKLAVNMWRKVRVRSDQLLVEPQQWAVLDYARLESANVVGEMSWNIGRAGLAHGVCVWFKSTLVEGVSFSTGPDEPERIYGSGLFPLAQPVPVSTGDVVTLKLSASLIGTDYVWRWITEIREAGPRGDLKANFDQSTFAGGPPPPIRLPKVTVVSDGDAESG